jgi:hypothetical protein
VKELAIIEGPGFFDQDDLLNLSELSAYRIKKITWNDAKLAQECEVPQVFLLRGAWTAGLEERLLVRQLATALAPGLEVIERRQKAGGTGSPLLIGMGRGALVVLASKAFGLCDFDTLEWEPCLVKEGPWVRVKLSAQASDPLPALVQGRARPVIKGGRLKELEPWLRARRPDGGEDDVLGLKLGNQILLSFVDLLAYSDRAQMPDYGYKELTAVPTQSKILAMLVNGVF